MSAPFEDFFNFRKTDTYAWDPEDPISNQLMECKKHELLFSYLNNSSNEIDNLAIYKKSKHDDNFYHLSSFTIGRKNNRIKATVSPTIRTVYSIERRITSQQRYEAGMCKIIALIQYGYEVDSINDMYCLSGISDIGWPVKDRKTGKITMVKMGLTLHHILFVGGNSKHKENSDVGPSQLLRTLDLTNADSGRYPENIKAIHEFLSCVIINAGHHNELHRVCDSGGYEDMVGLDIMPYYLKSESNYNHVCLILKEKYGYDITMTYEQRINSLKLNP